jgi:hypothetical protein
MSTRYARIKSSGRVVEIEMNHDKDGKLWWFYTKSSLINYCAVHGPYWVDDKRFEILPNGPED